MINMFSSFKKLYVLNTNLTYIKWGEDRMENRLGQITVALEKGLVYKDSYKEYFNASVLIPLVWEKEELAVLFEVRSPHLTWQPGEICFPGGRIDPTDGSPQSAAVRETVEELGLPAEKINVLGSLQEVVSQLGVRLYPFVGYITESHHMNPSPDEVSEVFTVPLDFLLASDPIIGHMERCTRPLADFPFALLGGYSDGWKRRKNYQVLFYQYGQHVIWGLTAQVLHNFLEIYREFIDQK